MQYTTNLILLFEVLNNITPYQVEQRDVRQQIPLMPTLNVVNKLGAKIEAKRPGE